MQQINFFMVDAFTITIFGNSATAVYPFMDWLPDETLLKMAQQYNRSETTFFVANENGLKLHWFTTQGEINPCGHAALAAARVIFEYLDYLDTKTQFATRFVGPLIVTRYGEWLTLDFPARQNESAIPPALLLETLSITEYKEVRVARDYMVVLKNQQRVEAIRPSIYAMIPLGKMICITASGDGGYDLASRFFCPGEAVAEGPVTGSAHSTLTPYWAEKLNKTQTLMRQISERGGDLRYQLAGTRVYISRRAMTYLTGRVLLRQQPHPE